MHFIAQELREILASLGLKRVEDLVGRTDLLQRSSTLKANSKAASIDVEKLLCPFDGPNTKEIQQNHNLEHGFDLTNLYEVTKPYIAEGRRYTGSFTVNNEQRDVGLLQVVRFRNNMEKQDFLKIQLMFIRMVMLVKVLQHMHRKA
ncbi:glutamate synthase [NADPH] large subunit [Staphylococcus aureus]|nr:glutamate synthase [NADPH] large subunit [Staphylococcus aureus]